MRTTKQQPTPSGEAQTATGFPKARKVTLYLYNDATMANGRRLREDQVEHLVKEIELMQPGYLASILFKLVVHSRPKYLDKYERELLVDFQEALHHASDLPSIVENPESLRELLNS